MIFCFYLCFVILCHFPSVESHASNMLLSAYCNNPQLTVGTYIMGSPAVSSSARNILIYRGTTLLTSGSPYVAGETLRVHLSSTSNTAVDQWSYGSNEYIFEATIAKFSSGGCNGRRYSGAIGNLVMPAAGSGSVTVWGGFAYNEGTVGITSTFTLADPNVVTSAPSRSPTSRPSVVPTLPLPTISPTPSPSRLPTATPTTLQPSSAPTPTPTSQPSTSPTVSPSSNPSLSPTSRPSAIPTLVISTTSSPSVNPTSEPTSLPTTSLAPTAQPSSTSPTVQPSTNPSRVPTSSPSISPSSHPSSSPSNSPTNLPTPRPSAEPTTSRPTSDPTNDPTSEYLITYGDDAISASQSMAKSIVIGGAAVIFPFFVGAIYLFVMGGVAITISFAMKAYIFATVAFVCGAAAVVLVIVWTSNSNTSGQLAQLGYLGVPSYHSNPLAWHPALMVGGVFYGQVIAISSWSLLPTTFQDDKIIVKYIHAFFHTVSACCMIASLVAIVRHMYMNKLESLTTIHSWIGVMASMMFGSTYIFGWIMALMKLNDASSFDFRAIHRICGMVSFGLIVLAIATGVMDQLPAGQCYYLTTDFRIYPSLYKYPINHYDDLPDACKIAHGMVILVIIASLSVIYMVSMRPNNNNMIIENIIEVAKPVMIISVCITIVYICGALAVILMVLWLVGTNEYDGPYGQRGYLGLPSFETNPLSWHVAMMVGGVFYGQVFAILTWSIIPSSIPKYVTKSIHVLFQTASAGCMIFGLICIVHNQYTKHRESLTTIHSWIGVAASGMFGFSYLFGCMMTIMTICMPNASYHKSIDSLHLHRILGLTSFGLIVCAIATGVMDQLAPGVCYYLIDADRITPSLYKYPGIHYQDMPYACKYAHGMVTLIVISAILVVIVVSLRSPTSSSSPHPTSSSSSVVPSVSPSPAAHDIRKTIPAFDVKPGRDGIAKTNDAYEMVNIADNHEFL